MGGGEVSQNSLAKETEGQKKKKDQFKKLPIRF